MATRRCVQLLCATLVILCNDRTVAGDTIGGKGGWSTDCAAVKSRTWTFSPPAAFPTARHLQQARATWEHLEQHLQTAEVMLEQVKRHLDPLDTLIDCSAIFQASNGMAYMARSGVYTIRPAGTNRSVPVYCRMEGRQGWTVLMRRQDGSVPFYRAWEEYKAGFGNLSTEFWLGNENIHLLTNQARYKMRVDLETFDGEASYAQYGSFTIQDEASKYRLILGRFNGTARNALAFSNHMAFATWDNDTVTKTASRFKSAGWLSNTFFPNLHGVYYTPQTVRAKKGLDRIKWYVRRDHKGKRYPFLKFVEMRIAPEDT